MPLFAQKQPESPADLSNEIVAARQQYEATKQSVITRAVDRRAAVQATIADLQAESAALTDVVTEASQV